MADYQPLIARAVAGLEKNTGEGRRALYERARAALVAELRGRTPPLDESEITRERLALEEAIRKVEAESVRQAREVPRPPPVRRSEPARRAQPPPAATAAQRPTPTAKPAAPAAPSPAAAAASSAAPQAATAPTAVGAAPPGAAPRPPAPPAAAKPVPPSPARPGAASAAGAAGQPRRAETPAAPTAGAKRSLSDQALKGFRDVVSDPAAAKEQARAAQREERAQAVRSLPQAATLPPLERPPIDKHGAGEPQGAPENLWALPLDERPAPPVDLDAAHPAAARPRPPREEPQEWEQEESTERPPRRFRGLIAAAAVLFAIIAAGAFAFWQRDAILQSAEIIVALLQTPSAPPPPKDAAPAPSTKIVDRIGRPAPQPSGLPVAQRVVLYEEAPDDPQGVRSIGTVVWRTEIKPAAPGRAPELAVRGDIEVPERKMTVSFTLRRNTDQSLPASHTIEIVFALPPDSPVGGVQNVPGVLMKQAEQTRGTPLAGLAVKVTPGYFLIGLSALETDVQRNITLLKDRPWFDIPIVYNNNRRAILALEKGTPGEKVFAQAFAAWRE
jgi:hypothetical protein